MNIAKLLHEIDELEARLRLVRSILTGEQPGTAKKSVGRPPKTAVETPPKRVMSEAGRKAIAAAQKKRWAAKKAAEKKAAAKK